MLSCPFGARHEVPGLQRGPRPEGTVEVIVSPADMATLKQFFSKLLPPAFNLSWDRSIVPLGRGHFPHEFQALRAWLRSCCPSGTKPFRPSDDRKKSMLNSIRPRCIGEPAYPVAKPRPETVPRRENVKSATYPWRALRWEFGNVGAGSQTTVQKRSHFTSGQSDEYE
jgi:hypothetical protein